MGIKFCRVGDLSIKSILRLFCTISKITLSVVILDQLCKYREMLPVL